ncbi:MAG: tRNA 2-thiouridine(34) synthase MnmA [Anaerolineales bacterium]|nr:tRNA 2-thiouridine(34) synthase MnmA [Anaerolineales bacterium]MCB9127542.1 tRNA 2-thiouridine(34) synthase MnmA [Ardenticatenales bacterium]
MDGVIAACEIRDWSRVAERAEAGPPNGKRVVVAMSGGVDSSVAALLLHQQGYEVIGLMLRLWSGEEGYEDEFGFKHNGCCTPDAVEDARALAHALGAPFYLKNLETPFYDAVVDPFIQSYLEGRTPNPCLNCNRTVRFTHLLNMAELLGADYLATGHYARIRGDAESGFQLLKGVDPQKDQSYVLHSLTQAKLAKLRFPIGEMEKPAVRALAAEWGLPTASKHDSMDLCFIASGDYRDFLLRHAPEGSIRSGPILLLGEREVGQHDGLPFYTIGQRRGLGIGWHEPLYVLGADRGRNALIVGPKAALATQTVEIERVNWIAGAPPAAEFETTARARYKAAEVTCTVQVRDDDRARVTFHQPQRAITPGQGCVFYEGEQCLGGGLFMA